MRKNQIQTLPDLLRDAAATHPGHKGIVLDGASRTYLEWMDAADRCARALKALGLEPGSHVGIMTSNSLEYMDLLFGAMAGGFVPVTINSRYKSAELQYVLPHSDIRCLFTSTAPEADYLAVLKEAFPALDLSSSRQNLAHCPLLDHVFLLHGAPSQAVSYAAFLSQADSAAGQDTGAVPLDADGDAFMMYTSGTTAQPKGCLLSHRSVLGNALSIAERWHMTERDRFYDPLPFFHMSTILPLITCMVSRSTFYATAYFDVDEALDTLYKDDITMGFFSFPTLTNAIIHHPKFDGERLPGLRLIQNVAPEATLRQYEAAFPHAIQVSAYGLTEAGGVISFGAPDDPADRRRQSSGRPFPHIEVRVVDIEEPEKPVPVNETGNIQIRGYCLFNGYHKDPDATSAALTQDGWLKTGDLGSVDEDGFITYRGRSKDMLKVGGENVAALEIESHLNSHPAIALSQVIAVPDEKLIEVPAAFIQCVDGAELSAEEVIAHCRGAIARFKIPRYVVFVSEWPMSATKIQKFRLKEMPLGERHEV